MRAARLGVGSRKDCAEEKDRRLHRSIGDTVAVRSVVPLLGLQLALARTRTVEKGKGDDMVAMKTLQAAP